MSGQYLLVRRFKINENASEPRTDKIANSEHEHEPMDLWRATAAHAQDGKVWCCMIYMTLLQGVLHRLDMQLCNNNGLPVSLDQDHVTLDGQPLPHRSSQAAASFVEPMDGCRPPAQ